MGMSEAYAPCQRGAAEHTMAKITFFLGLAGSGKTWQAKRLEEETGAERFEGILGKENPEALPRIIQLLKAGRSCSIEEIQFCRPQWREWIEARLRSQAPDVEIEWYCFENDLEKANWNVENRPDKGNILELHYWNEQWHDLYEYPKGVEPTPIYRIPKRR